MRLTPGEYSTWPDVDATAKTKPGAHASGSGPCVPADTHAKLDDVLALLRSLADEERDVPDRARSVDEKIDAILAEVEQLGESLRSREQQQRDLQNRVNQVERLALVGEFSASLSHELRAPLQTILSANELIQTRDITPRVQALARMIEREVFLANRLIDNARSLTRRPVHLESVALSKIIDEFAEFSRLLLSTQNVRLKTGDLAQLQPVRADVDQLRQVVLNLVTNAVDAILERYGSDPHPNRCIEITGRQGCESTTLDLRDYGSGIPDPVQHRIFDPFYTTRTGGLGIGLSITKKLVEDQGGAITFDTGPDGTTFHVELPVS